MRTRSELALIALVAAVAAGCGEGSAPVATHDSAALAAARAGSRPIGGGPRFVPPTPNVHVHDCRAQRGPRYGVHLELFAANRVVLIPAGVGTEPPRASTQGRLTHAACYGPVVTIDPTGLLLVRDGAVPRLRDLFHTWHARLGRTSLLSFRGRVRAYVGGHPWTGDPGAIPLARHAVIVLETGPYVPPHTHYVFPPGA